MSHSEKCPVCGGSGKYKSLELPMLKEETCHGCGGAGWVTVQDTPIFWPYPTTEIDDATTGGAK